MGRNGILCNHVINDRAITRSAPRVMARVRMSGSHDIQMPIQGHAWHAHFPSILTAKNAIAFNILQSDQERTIHVYSAPEEACAKLAVRGRA